MAEIIRMPRLSDTMEEGVIVGWLKEVGDAVSPGDVLAEVETDKATMELESFQEGFLLYIGVKEGAVPVDGVLAVIGEKGEDFQAQLDAALQSNGTEAKDAEKQEDTPKPAEEPAKAASSPASPAPAPVPSNGNSGGGRILASPLAKSIASESGVALQSLSGTGDGGRIIKRDVEAFLENRTKQPETRSIEVKTSPGIEYGDHPVSQMRKTIARRLSESKFGAPHFYLTIEIDMTDSAAQRSKVNAISDQKISFNDLIVKGVAMALRKHPKVNSSWFGDKITIHQDINIGVAVAVEEGLLVPVVRNADYKSLSELNAEVRSLAGKAKEKKLQLEEMQGNTFTVSNLGMFGIEEFTAIINPPDACILAIGAIIDKPVVKEGAIVVGKMMKVTLSCDHRVVDGATGAQFLKTLKMMLENPVSMMI